VTDSGAAGVDCHCHVFAAGGVDAPAIGDAAYSPPAVDVDDHAAHLAGVGCDRGVLVQPSVFGGDHRCLVASLRRRPQHLRGVACVRPGTPPAVLDGLHAAGVRATRLQDLMPGGVAVGALNPVSDLVAPWGWHVEIWTDIRRHLDWLGDAIRRCPVPVVFDHLGAMPSDAGLDHPAMQLLTALLAEGHVWVTLSGSERLFPGPSPRAPADRARHEEALEERVRALSEVAPGRLLWGSDWPHVGISDPPPVDELKGRLERWLPDPELRRRVLTDNALARYRFD
jgi:2-pyrone-4,6-dicarboxylate lactonase